MKRFAAFVLKLLGWKLTGSYPDIPRSVMIMAPHTSMWDFVFGKISFLAMGIPGKFMIKKEMFWFPLGPLLKALGGVPVDRSSGTKSINAAREVLLGSERMVLIITPEGTRKKVDEWKKGFYLIARHAKVPLVLGYLDYDKKVACVGPVVHCSGDFQADFTIISEFYKGRKGKHPERFNL